MAIQMVLQIQPILTPIFSLILFLANSYLAIQLSSVIQMETVRRNDKKTLREKRYPPSSSYMSLRLASAALIDMERERDRQHVFYPQSMATSALEDAWTWMAVAFFRFFKRVILLHHSGGDILSASLCHYFDHKKIHWVSWVWLIVLSKLAMTECKNCFWILGLPETVV